METDLHVQALTDFELQRAKLIARNRARLLALGIPEAVSGLSKLQPAPAPPKPKKRKAAKSETPVEPARKSKRLHDQELIARGEVPPDVEQGSELALFIIDGECPRCGKVLSTGHARHLQTCKGPPEPPTEEEVAAQAEAYKAQQKDKLKQLELGGLVDYVPGGSSSASQQTTTTVAAAEATADAPQSRSGSKRARKGSAATEATATAASADCPEDVQEQQQNEPTAKGNRKGKKSGAAKATTRAAGQSADDEEQIDDVAAQQEAYATFIVIGSTGNHYVVKLTDARRSCTCMDHRIRRRDCKHIRLVWEQLGIADKPQDWKQALEHHLNDMAAAEDKDVEMVHKAEARRKARADKQASAAGSKSKGK